MICVLLVWRHPSVRKSGRSVCLQKKKTQHVFQLQTIHSSLPMCDLFDFHWVVVHFWRGTKSRILQGIVLSKSKTDASSLFRTQDSPTLPSTAGETRSIQTRPRTHVTHPSLPCGTGHCSTARRGGTPSPSLSLLFLRPSRCSMATSTPTQILTG